MATSEPPSPPPGGSRLSRAVRVIVISSVMFTFISYWRMAAIVLCDLASTAFYIGGIVEQSIGPAAPWFILAVMIFSYTVRSVYIESSSLFVRGGGYRVVKEALGGFLAKLAVSALMFDFILTGPISSVVAGQYVVGLGLDAFSHYSGIELSDGAKAAWKVWGSVAIACSVTIYFFRQNIIGIHESSDKALKIMKLTTVMAVVLLVWCGLTLALEGPKNSVPLLPNLTPKLDPATDEFKDPLGFLKGIGLADQLRGLAGVNWLSVIGVIGFAIAFGHSILAMSGEETLAQVYRELESPKLKNFKKAAFIVFVYSLLLTGGVSFLAVLLIPDDVRMIKYADNLIGGLAMNVYGPLQLRFLLNAFVVLVGFVILSGAVNTAIIGSNGVLNRVAEDGVIPDWLLKPHPRYGTTYRLLWLIVTLQLFTIVWSQGNVLLLGEAYAFGVVWSFVFTALAMVVLRFRDRSPREFMVPLNIRVKNVEVPIGLGLIFIVLLISAIANLATKEMATKWGLGFTAGFFTLFMISEHFHEKRRRGAKHEHLEQFNKETAEEATRQSLALTHPYRKLVSIRSPQNLFMLEKTLAETDPATTDVVVMTAKVAPTDTGGKIDHPELDTYDQELMTAVVTRAERAGKEVKPLIILTNNPLHTILRTAKELQVQELILGASNKYTADEQLEQIGFYWFNLFDGPAAPLTVRILSRDRDVYLDLAGGNRIPKLSERQARSVAELRAAGVGVDRVLLAHDGSSASSDLFHSVLTMLDPQVALALVRVVPKETSEDLKTSEVSANGPGIIEQDKQRAAQLGRELQVLDVDSDWGPEIVRLAREEHFDLIIVSLPTDRPANTSRPWDDWTDFVLNHAHCQVLLAAQPLIPQEVAD